MKNRILSFLELGILILFSLAVMASALPAFANISNIPVVIYYLFIPGYSVTLLLGEEYNLVIRLGYAVLFGVTFVLSIFSLRSVFLGLALPYNIIIPSITILVAIFAFVRSDRIMMWREL